MPSLWPWKGEDNSPASFEKALSTLTTKIQKAQSQLDALRQRGRRVKALWTLYAIFAYILCFVILFTVVGWQNWTAVEYTAVAGSPILIYAVRTIILTYYTYRIDNVTTRLEAQQAERSKTIDKLKAATKYNSTQELLEKYGDAPPKPKTKKENTDSAPKTSRNPQQPARTSIGSPPPTANIPRPNLLASQPSTPQKADRAKQSSYAPSPASPQSAAGQAEFAPNAFAAPPQYASSADFDAGGHWYDRVLDLLLGEDETLPRNRVALICQNCRLVNGQAPPGTKSLIELGKWKCLGCGAVNGEEDEAAKAVQEMKERLETQEKTMPRSESAEPTEIDDVVAVEEASEGETAEAEESVGKAVEVKPKRGRPKGSRNKA